MRKVFLFLFLCAVCLLITATSAAADTINVPGDYSTIQEAINNAGYGDTVQVAAGVYNEDVTLKSGVIVQGAGAEVTTIQGTDTISVVTADNVDSNAKIDGFTITGGNASWGGGISCTNGSSLTISNNVITGNNASGSGGGIYSYWESRPTIISNTITHNTASYYGGGIRSYNSDATIVGNTISNNTAGEQGGGIHSWPYSTLTVTNNVISDNSATDLGGGICINRALGNPVVSSNTIYGNTAAVGGGLYSFQSHPNIFNCITWGNGQDLIGTQATYSDIGTGETGGEGNISEDPMFVNPGAGDFHLQATSPCIDSGTPTGAPSDDIEGTSRPQLAGYDMGAYEYVLIEATIDIKPDTLNLKSRGRFVTCYIELSEGYNVCNINGSTILLNGVVYAQPRPRKIGDYDDDGTPDLMVKFKRRAVKDVVEVGDEVEVVVTGELIDGTPFEGTDIIRVIDKGRRRHRPIRRSPWVGFCVLRRR